MLGRNIVGPRVPSRQREYAEPRSSAYQREEQKVEEEGEEAAAAAAAAAATVAAAAAALEEKAEDDNDNGHGDEEDRRVPPTERCRARRSRRRAATYGGRDGKERTGFLYRREPLRVSVHTSATKIERVNECTIVNRIERDSGSE